VRLAEDGCVLDRECTFRVQVLGPLVVVEADGRPLRLQFRRRATLLALLAIHPNEAVSCDELLDAGWPAGATATALHTQISRLRRRLGPSRLEYDGGYRLHGGSSDVDLLRFRELAAHEGSLQDLAQACALIRGPVLADVSELSSHPTVAAIRREVTAAVLGLADAALAAGEPGTAVEALTAALDREPLDEAVAACLVRVLAATGNRVRALQTYSVIRERIADDLGVDPGDELQRAYQESLGGPSLDVPRQLPAAVGGFIGREAQLRQLDEAAGRSDPVVITAVGGVGGVGKTALAVHWAHRVASAYPDGQLYVDLQGFSAASPVRPVDALAGFLGALGVPRERIPADVEQAAARFRSALSGKTVLVVLDNAADAAQVRPLLPASPGSLVLVTSRDRLGGLVAREGAVRLRLDTLTPAESLALLGRVLGPARIAAEPDAAARLATLCGHLPLALRIAAANVGDQPASLGEYTEHLAGSDLLTALRAGPELAVRAVFDASYTALSASAQRVFRLLGLIAGSDFTPDAVAALVGSVDAAELETLASGHLVDQHLPGRYRLHDLLRLYARDHAQRDLARGAAEQRLHDWYVYSVDAASELLYPQVARLPAPHRPPAVTPMRFGSGDDALAWLDAERANLLAAARRDDTGQLAGTLRAYVLLQMLVPEMRSMARAVLDAARVDDGSLAAAHLIMSDAARHDADYPAAIEHCRSAARLSSTAGWLHGQSAAVGNLANALVDTGRLREARTGYEQAFAINRQRGHRDSQAINLLNLGFVHTALGALDSAEQCYDQALELLHPDGNPIARGGAIAGIAVVAHRRGRLADARAYRIQAMDLFEHSADFQVDILAELAAVERDLGQKDAALEHVELALSRGAELDFVINDAQSHCTMATIQDRLGHRDAADEHFRVALQLAERNRLRKTWIEALTGLTVLHCDEQYAQRALPLARESGMRLAEADVLTALAAVCGGERANLADEALSIFRDAGAGLGEARALVVLGHACHDAGDPPGARQRWADALTIFTECEAAPEADGVRALLA
jgi:DNA-binding SARP family transcriptional activator/tetratricopeptide (TPR) repeat protein